MDNAKSKCKLEAYCFSQTMIFKMQYGNGKRMLSHYAVSTFKICLEKPHLGLPFVS